MNLVNFSLLAELATGTWQELHGPNLKLKPPQVQYSIPPSWRYWFAFLTASHSAHCKALAQAIYNLGAID